MRRGTTPTFNFKLPIDCKTIEKLHITFAQYDKIILEKTLDCCKVDGDTISLTLTEEETLLFECGGSKRPVDIQLRVGIGETRLASDIMTVNVEKILKDGCL